MADVEIDRLTLQVPGLPAEQGHRLAEMVVAGLERARFAPAQPTGDVTINIVSSGTSLEQLAGSIVEALRRQMAEGG